MLHSILYPSSIAIIGGSSDIEKPGGKLVYNIKTHDYKGKLWIVNPKSTDVQGLPTFKNIPSLPASPELGIITVAAQYVKGSLLDLIYKGVKGVIIITCGFGEIDEDGKKEEKELVRIARNAGIPLIGPNCMGVATDVYAGVFAGPIPPLKPRTIDFVSGSGATAAFILERGLALGMTISSEITVGNSAMIGIEEVLEYWDDEFEPDKSSLVKMLYMETINNPQKLLKHCLSLRRKGCDIVAIKAGSTEAGTRAASSHTGALASSDTATAALLTKAGVIRVQSKEELVDTSGILAAYKKPQGKRACIVTHAGGPGVMLTDELCRQGFDMPRLDDDLQKKLHENLLPGSAVGNPVDFLAAGTAEHLDFILESLRDVGDIDLIPIIFGSPGLFDVWPVYKVIADKLPTYPKRIYPVFPSTITAKDAIDKFLERGYFCVPEEVNLGNVLGRITSIPVSTEEARRVEGIDRAELDHLLKITAEGEKQLKPDVVTSILKALGIPVPMEAYACEMDEAVRITEEIGFPLVMKVIGPVHKSDVGGVLLGISSMEEMKKGFNNLISIVGAEGVLFQEMARGIEVILGISREVGGFGHLIMFGLGGIYTEVLKDVAFSLAPVSRDEALRQVTSIKSFKILEGVRGKKGMNIQRLVDIILRLSYLVENYPQVKEMDINPLMGYEDKLLAVDARIEIE